MVVFLLISMPIMSAFAVRPETGAVNAPARRLQSVRAIPAAPTALWAGAARAGDTFVMPVQKVAVATDESEIIPIAAPDASAPAGDVMSESELIELANTLADVVKALNTEIETLDSEIARCRRSKSAAQFTTAIGTGGAIVSAITAVIQGSKLNTAQKEDNDK